MTEALTAEAFYRLRDDRTNRVVERPDYHNLHVRVVSDHSTVQSVNGQVQLIMAANLLARWCRQMEFGFPDAPLLGEVKLNGVETLHERIQLEVTGADPFCQFSFQSAPSTRVQYTLKVGSLALPADEQVNFTIDARGWYACAERGEASFDNVAYDNNIASAAFAACIGVADAFKVALKLPDHMRIQHIIFSLFDFSMLDEGAKPITLPAPLSVRIGYAQIVGAGSVGSAVVYLLRMLPIEGIVGLIDADIVKYENLNRSPLFKVSDVGLKKVDVAASFLNEYLPTTPHPMLYSEYIAQYGRKKGAVDLLLPLANEFGVRQDIENNCPPLQVYGTTTSDWGVNYHRHIPLLDDCSFCRFPQEVNAAAMVCSEAQVENERGEQIDAALPFVSVAAAVLTIAELMKLQLPDYPATPNFLLIDLKGDFQMPLSYTKAPRSACLCQSRSRRVHASYIESTRFSELSLAASAPVSE